MRDEVINAIQNHLGIVISYEPGLRFVEPHVLGYGSQGQLLLRAHQTEGASESGEHVDWKLFRIDRIASLELGEPFNGTRPQYNPDDPAMKGGIIAAL